MITNPVAKAINNVALNVENKLKQALAEGYDFVAIKSTHDVDGINICYHLFKGKVPKPDKFEEIYNLASFRKKHHGYISNLSSSVDNYAQKIKKQMIEKIRNLENPYPKDIFVWDDEEPIEIRNDKNLIDVVITRGMFNHFVFEVVENTKQDIIKVIKQLFDEKG